MFSWRNRAVIKTLLTFHYTGWLIGIHVITCHNPLYNPLGSMIPYITQPTVFFFRIAHLRTHLSSTSGHDMPMAPLVTPQNLTTFKALYVLFTSLCDLWREAVRMFETIASKQQATRKRTNKSKQQQATPSNNKQQQQQQQQQHHQQQQEREQDQQAKWKRSWATKQLPIPKVLGKTWPQTLFGSPSPFG